MANLYNENDAYAARWLRELSERGHIAAGEIDDRSIEEIGPEDVRGTAQFHAFAGIGGWSYALRLAGWPDAVPVWTGSCPCQPFSTAGRRKGATDARHLWPAWFALIRECRPAVIFGEQVAAPDGRLWLDAVSLDLESLGYAVGAADLCAAGVGAPHIRQRLFFVALADHERCKGIGVQLRGRQPRSPVPKASWRGEVGELGNSGSEGGGWHPGTVLGTQEEGEGKGGEPRRVSDEPQSPGPARVMGNTSGKGSSIRSRPEERRGAIRHEGASVAAPGATHGAWAGAAWVPCRDEKWRPVEPGTQPLAHGVASRVGRLRAYGNAIVPQVAARFVAAAIETICFPGKE